MMTPEDALARFLSRVLQKRWRERYASIIRTRRGKKTFLRALYHTIEGQLDSAKAVIQLPDQAWQATAYSFSESAGFGHQEKSLRAAFDSAGDGSLVIDVEGNCGVHQPEGMVDDIRYFSV